MKQEKYFTIPEHRMTTITNEEYINQIDSFLDKNNDLIQKTEVASFFKEILPNFQKGIIDYHEHQYQLSFNLLCRFNNNDLLISPNQQKNENNEENIPTLNIKDLQQFSKNLSELVTIIKEKIDNCLWIKSRKTQSTQDAIKDVLEQIWFNATPYDFQNPERYLQIQKSLIEDENFSSLHNEKTVGALKSLKDSTLTIQRTEQSGSNESKFIIEPFIYTNNAESKIDIPVIRYGISETTPGEKVAYIYAIQTNKIPKDANQNLIKQKKKLDRIFYKLNDGIIKQETTEFQEYNEKRKNNELQENDYYPENISDITPASLYSAVIAIELFKKIGIKKILVPSYYPLRWQAHSRLGDEENTRIQSNMTEKFIRIFRRVEKQIPCVEITAFPDDNDNYLHMSIYPDNKLPENELLKELIDVINNIEIQ